MALPEYTLSAVIQDHTDQVRGVRHFPPVHNGILTCSFDRTVKLWKPVLANEGEGSSRMVDEGVDEGGVHCELLSTMVGHVNFVIDIVPVRRRVEGGGEGERETYGVVSVSHDKSIILWNEKDGSIVLKKENAHESPISCLTVTPTGLIVTGSWDKTAKVWNSDLTQCLYHLKGHEMNVLCVLGLPNASQDIVTGSGDGSIKIWRNDKEIRSFRAHTTCVRGLDVLPNVGFLSCANDGVVKLWSFEGDEIQSLQAHDTLCYAITVISSSPTTFLTCSEDKTIKIWENFQCTQTIPHPNTVWNVAALPNGDIVTACADNRARVFTKNKDRVASESTITAFHQENEKARKKTTDTDVSKLPPVTVLSTEVGKKEGEVKVVNDDGVGNAYQWDARAQQWQLVGEVVSGPGVGQNLVGKECLNGKFYDHVFDVELDDGRSYKIGFNEGDNPYDAAQEFINQHDLPQHHLETIANFIMDNFGGGDSSGGRTIAPTRVVDPWNTSTAPASSSSQGKSPQTHIKHFPSGYALLETANLAGIAKKIKEFNTQLQSLTQAEMNTFDALIAQLGSSKNIIREHMLVLDKMMAWPATHVFPVMDLIRVVVLVKSAADYYVQQVHGGSGNIVSNMIHIGFLDNKANNIILQLMTLRFLSNAFRHDMLRNVLIQTMDTMMDAITSTCEKSRDDKLRGPYAKVLQNLMVHFGSSKDDAKKQHLLELSKNFINANGNGGQLNAETLYALLRGIGTLIHDNTLLQQHAANVGLGPIASRCKSNKDPKVSAAAQQLSQLIK